MALRNSLPIYLDQLAEALAGNRKMDLNSVFIHDLEAVRIGKLSGTDHAGGQRCSRKFFGSSCGHPTEIY